MLKRMLCDARIGLSIEVKGPVLIKAGEANLTGPDMAFVRSNAYGAGRSFPYLPGTALKGIIRSHVERFARTLKPAPAVVCLPYEFAPDATERSCGKRLEQREPLPKREAYRRGCPACRMFGSLQFQGRVTVDDAYADDPTTIQEERRDGVAIDRKTGGAAARAKYDLQVVTRGVFRTTINLENFEAWQFGAIGLVLADLADERIRIGSGSSRGLGHVRGIIEGIELRYPRRHDGTFCGIEALATAEERGRNAYGLFTRANAPRVELGLRKDAGLWSSYRPEGAPRVALMDRSRDDFVAYIDQCTGLQ